MNAQMPGPVHRGGDKTKRLCPRGRNALTEGDPHSEGDRKHVTSGVGAF